MVDDEAVARGLGDVSSGIRPEVDRRGIGREPGAEGLRHGLLRRPALGERPQASSVREPLPLPPFRGGEGDVLDSGEPARIEPFDVDTDGVLDRHRHGGGVGGVGDAHVDGPVSRAHPWSSVRETAVRADRRDVDPLGVGADRLRDGAQEQCATEQEPAGRRRGGGVEAVAGGRVQPCRRAGEVELGGTGPAQEADRRLREGIGSVHGPRVPESERCEAGPREMVMVPSTGFEPATSSSGGKRSSAELRRRNVSKLPESGPTPVPEACGIGVARRVEQ